jgi:type IV pilus assembly protein PilV
MKKINFPNHKIKNVKLCAGFTLIEVLIALLILAIGVLGIAALQFKALRYSYDTNIRNQISFLSSEIADRMRINRTNIADYVANYTVDIDNPSAACNNATGANAANDLLCWYNAIDAVMPHDSTANITATGSLYTVAMGWTDREGQTHTIEYSFQ